MDSKEISVPVKKLHPGPDNPRIEPGDVTELTASIRRNEVIQPLLVTPAPRFGEGHYYIEAGERRWTAARYAPLAELPCRVITRPEGRSPSAHSVIIGLIENVHRKELSAIEKARAFGRLRDEEKMTQRQIAEELGFDESTVSRCLMLLEFSSKDQERIQKKELKVDDAIKIVRQTRVLEVAAREAGLDVPFQPPVMASGGNHA